MASTLYSRSGTDPDNTAALLGQYTGSAVKEIPYDYVRRSRWRGRSVRGWSMS
jgi:hypothetical protein